MAEINFKPSTLNSGTIALGKKADEMGSYAMQVAQAISAVSGSDPNAKVTLPDGRVVGIQEASEILKTVRRYEEKLAEIAQEIGDHEAKKAKRLHEGITQIWQ